MSDLTESRRWSPIRAVAWQDGGCVLLDQRRLPAEETYLRLGDSAGVARAIADMVVRGAPAIGIAAAYGAAMAYREASDDEADLAARLAVLRAARPTASNLAWAIRRVSAAGDRGGGDRFAAALGEARAIHEEDVAMNHAMGRLGASLIGDRSKLVTHCNAGALATGGFGTALGVVRQAWSDGW